MLKGEFGRLAARLGEWPLLVKLVNGALRKRINDYTQPVIDALSDVNQSLTRRGLTAFDRRNSSERNDAVAKTIGLSVALLEGDEKERYQELAVFPEDLDIPLAAVEKLWGATAELEPFECKELCERLADLSLLLKFVLPQTRDLMDRAGERQFPLAVLQAWLSGILALAVKTLRELRHLDFFDWREVSCVSRRQS